MLPSDTAVDTPAIVLSVGTRSVITVRTVMSAGWPAAAIRYLSLRATQMARSSAFDTRVRSFSAVIFDEAAKENVVGMMATVLTAASPLASTKVRDLVNLPLAGLSCA